MSDVDKMFDKVVNFWMTSNIKAPDPNFDELAEGIESYNDLCKHAAWNEVGRHFLREGREDLGIQCLAEALRQYSGNDSAAWSGIKLAPDNSEAKRVSEQLRGLPGPPVEGDRERNVRIVADIQRIIGKPGKIPEASPQASSPAGSMSPQDKSHTRTTPATTRTAALDGLELRRLLAESRLSNLLKEQFAPPEYKYEYVLTPAELCDIADSLGDEAIILWQVEKPGRLDAESDVIVSIEGKSGGIGPTIMGLYTFDSGHYAERVWTNKQILPENLSLESIKRMLDIRGRTAVNFRSGSYSYTPGKMEQVTSSQLWERLCSHCDTLGIRLS